MGVPVKQQETNSVHHPCHPILTNYLYGFRPISARDQRSRVVVLAAAAAAAAAAAGVPTVNLLGGGKILEKDKTWRKKKKR